MRLVYSHEIAYALSGMQYPAQLWQIRAWAAHNGAGYELRQALYRLPAREYAEPGDVVTQLFAAGVGVSRDLRTAEFQG